MNNHLFRRIYRHIAEMTWGALLCIGIGHFISSWLMAIAFEPDGISASDVFWYYYLVTATTVGYGDFVPATAYGRAVAVLWIMPGAIALFTTAIAKAAQAMAEKWRRTLRGRGDYHMLQNHIVIIGWRGERTERLIDQLTDVSSGEAPTIVLISSTVSKNPVPDVARFVRADNTSDVAAYERAGMAQANTVIVMANTDPDALAISLAAAAAAPDVRLVVYFEDERMANLLKTHCPGAETAPSLSTEILARTARDPGSAELFTLLASSSAGPTEFSMLVPAGAPSISYSAALTSFKAKHEATLLGMRSPDTMIPLLNAPGTAIIKPGDQLYYISMARIDADAIDWDALAA